MQRSTTPSPVPWLLALAGLALAAFLLVYYVNLLQDVVARGSQFRYAQHGSHALVTAKSGDASVASP